MAIYIMIYTILLIPGWVLFSIYPYWSSLIPFGIWCYLSYKVAYSAQLKSKPIIDAFIGWIVNNIKGD